MGPSRTSMSHPYMSSTLRFHSDFTTAFKVTNSSPLQREDEGGHVSEIPYMWEEIISNGRCLLPISLNPDMQSQAVYIRTNECLSK